ncbi:hypothetical protein F0562_001770 [Nyssa sinensis]|uniref:Uncharacterized protein n=1 Tax=Nyssa sinensis TaxID=561372 RepID=A0A5J5C545_9ASTE|nr:hypothetical protein F0562_001770 [Nyssa sinensis]
MRAPKQILNQQFEDIVLDKRIEEDLSGLIIVLQDIFVGQVLEQPNNVDGNIGIVVGVPIAVLAEHEVVSGAPDGYGVGAAVVADLVCKHRRARSLLWSWVWG